MGRLEGQGLGYKYPALQQQVSVITRGPDQKHFNWLVQRVDQAEWQQGLPASVGNLNVPMRHRCLSISADGGRWKCR